MRNNIIRIFLFSIPLLITSCEGAKEENNKNTEAKKTENIQVPEFNADSAYHFVEAQVAFGPRVPNTEAHEQTAVYLENTLRRFTPDVIVQSFQQRAFDGTVLNGKNIMGRFNKSEKKRILLASHWDSRPFADHDPDEANYHTPIDGANDGASGVGILLEIARIISQQSPTVGVDVIFFDLEDYGVPHFLDQSDNKSWALGSQYWANNPLPMDYNANFGILLDMVGAKDAIFKMEHYSMYYAPHIVKKVWRQAGILGHGGSFILEDGGMVMDDHIPVNEIMRIPMIDIIHYDPSTESGFFPHWHTIHDNMDQIDKDSLNAVGETLTYVIFYE